jgi:AmiR/NasT family two-component response regulator
MADTLKTYSSVDGFIIDLSGSLRRETERVAAEAVHRATITRSTIEQAKAMLMGTLRISSDVAFGVLIAYSQKCNVKISSIAADLVEMAGDQQKAGLLGSFLDALKGVARA